MFYHQGILQRRGGKFGTVWLAATKIDQLKRRDFCAVNVRRACDDILDYILVRILPKRHGTGHPRFSLYLSSQLMYGVIRIYKRQNDYLLDDVTSFFCKMRIAVATLDEIDMKAISRPEQITIDFDDLCAENPWFGTLHMESGDLLRSPQLPNLETWRVESSLSIPRSPVMSPAMKVVQQTGLPATPPIVITEPILKPDTASPHTVASKEEITIPEIDMTLFQDIQIPPEHDLPNFDGKQVESILEEPLPGELQMGKYLSPIKVPQYEEQQLDLAHGMLSPKERTPMMRPDKSSVPERRERVLSPGITPAPLVEEPAQRPRRNRASFILQLSPVPPSPRRQRKRRHLCIDQQTQIHKDQLKECFRNRDDIIRPFVLPDMKSSSIQDLFNNPGQSGLNRNPRLLQLWRRNAVYGLLETESDIEQPAWSVPNLLEESRPTRSKRRLVAPQESPVRQEPDPMLMQEPGLEPIPEQTIMMEEQPSVEVARDGSISMERSRVLDETPVSIHQKSIRSEHDKSRELDQSKSKDPPSSRSKRKSRTRGSISGEEMEVNIPVMEDILGNQSVLQELSSVMEEKEIPITPGPLPVMTTPTAEDLLRMIRRYSNEDETVTFQRLCPPDRFDRTQAANMFADLLSLCKNKLVNAEQEVAFKDIYIWRNY